jgi:hypothetical protein
LGARVLTSRKEFKSPWGYPKDIDPELMFRKNKKRQY